MADRDDPPKLSPTPRAYTLRLAPAAPDDPSWRSRLWRTHVAVNRGAAAFGDWLLTLRGGLDHGLAELPELTEADIQQELVELRKAAKSAKPAPKPAPDEADARASAAEKRDARLGERRVLLALSWLTVEVGYTGPAQFNLGRDKLKVTEALCEILQQRGLTPPEIDDWVRHCRGSLEADIKDSATWVNRSAAFDAATARLGSSLTREEVWDLLLPFFGSITGYLEPVALEGEETGGEEKAKDLVQKAGQWLSSRFGTGQGVDFTRLARVYDAIKQSAATAVGPIIQTAFFDRLAGALAEFAPAAATPEAILSLISGPGYKSATRNWVKALGNQAVISPEDLTKFARSADEDAEASRGKTGGKGHREWSDRLLAQVEAACGFSYLGGLKSDKPADDEAPEREAARHSEFAVMLDHAARRVCLAHTWAKRAEAERRQFTCEAAKLEPLHAQHTAAVQWLDEFCARRSASSHAEDAYRIRPRAVEGWKEIVAAWRKAACVTPGDRIEAARALQDSDQVDKFGDIQLFEALADDDARCVWESGPDLLLDYAKATDAQHKKQRFKVPAYCHPDPLRHPVFCDFGNSRWDVDFAFHRARTGTAEARRTVTRRREAVAKVEAQLAKAKDDTARADKQSQLAEARTKLAEAESHLRWLETPRAITLTLLDGDRPQPTGLRWQSKRLAADLALADAAPADSPAAPATVTRADRHGRASAGVGPGKPVVVLGLFKQDHWNCRLQAPREQLEALATHLEKRHLPLQDEARWDERARSLRDAIGWFVTFSAKLQPQGPWTEFAQQHADRIRPELKDGEIAVAPRGKSDWSGLAFPFWHLDNQKGRTGRALHALSRLPGLRLLSADLGHRFGAACAVWETLSPESLRSLCGVALPGPDQLFHTVTTKGADGRDRTTLLRRIGPDTLPDGTPHPAPWARLERQFLIKLQGEEADAREASNEEIWFVHQLEQACGLAVPLVDRLVAAGFGKSDQWPKQRVRLDELRRLGWRPASPAIGHPLSPMAERRPSLAVDELMRDAVETLRRALDRHASRARLARDLNNLRPPGMGGKDRATDLAGEDLVQHLQELFLEWHALAFHKKAPEIWAQDFWKLHIAPHLKEQLADCPEAGETGPARKKRIGTNRDKLKPAAEHWAKRDRMALAARWHAAWIEADGKPAEVPAREPGATKGPAQTKPTSPGSGLHEWMRRLGDWLRPAGLRKDRKQSGGGTGTQTDWSRVRSARNTGGLSVRRLVTLREFYNVQKAFLGREKFADGIWDHADFAGRQPVQRTLDALERLREQRVKQLASRIAAAALGLAPAPPTPGERSAQGREAVRAARMRLSKLEPRFAPCHAVVIERLSNYTPDQLRTRRENRQLMQWSSSKVQKYLAEACQLNGLHLREVPPAYTSRQDSRTGAPGLRCVDVPLKDFLREGSFWQRDAEKVRRKSDRERKAAEQLLLDTFDSWKAFAAHPTPDQAQRLAHGSVRLLRAGGDVFVSAHPDSPAAKGLQADLNAAANIGLKALLDPDWPGSWWLVPCVRGTHAPKPDAVKGCPLFSDMKQLTPRHGTAGVKKGKAEREFVNLWRDPGNAPLTTGDWVESTTYWAGVQRRVAAVLRPHNGLSDARPSSAHDVRGNHEPEDDLVV